MFTVSVILTVFINFTVCIIYILFHLYYLYQLNRLHRFLLSLLSSMYLPLYLLYFFPNLLSITIILLGSDQNYYTRTGPTFGVGGLSKTPPIFRLISWTLPTTFYWLLNLSWHKNTQLARVGITRQTRKVRFESHCNLLLLDKGVAMQ